MSSFSQFPSLLDWDDDDDDWMLDVFRDTEKSKEKDKENKTSNNSNSNSHDKKNENKNKNELSVGEWRRKCLPASCMKLDIKDNDTNFEISADVPGVELKNLSVDVKKNVLSISAERSGCDEVKQPNGNGNFTRVERYSGRVCRSFTLPDNVEADKISAELLNGVLHVRVPKLVMEDAKKKTEFKIDIKSASSSPAIESPKADDASPSESQ